jgi:hypothetical protein
MAARSLYSKGDRTASGHSGIDAGREGNLGCILAEGVAPAVPGRLLLTSQKDWRTSGKAKTTTPVRDLDQ